MRGARPCWPAALLAAAVVVEAVACAGWLRWRSLVAQVHSAPAAGVAALADARPLWPEMVRRLRRPPIAELRAAPDATVARALDRLGTAQTTWTPADAVGFANLARAAFIYGALDTAADNLDAALTRDPTSPGLYRLAAIADAAQGRRGLALDRLAQAQALAPGTGFNAIDITADEVRRIRLEGLERRLTLYPRARTQGVIALARELSAQGDRARGRDMLDTEADDPRVALEAARWDADDGDLERARQRLAELADRPGLPSSMSAQIWAARAAVRARLGDADGAVGAARTALSFDPTSPTPYRVLADLAQRRGDLDEALDHLRRAWGMNPTDVRLLVAVASVAERAGKLDDARLALERAVAVEPDDPGLRARLVQFHLRSGELMSATVVLSEALERFPDDTRLLGLADRLRSEVQRHRR